MTNIIRELHEVKQRLDDLVVAEFPLERLTVLEEKVELILKALELEVVD